MRRLNAPSALVPAALEVVDFSDGLFRLHKRGPTLDGSVPLRVAQGCVPLLMGNAWGLQLELLRPLTLARSIPVLKVALAPESREELERVRRAAVPRLAASGLLPRANGWERLLRAPLAAPSLLSLSFFTGLLVKPGADTWLRLTSGANRRSTLFEVDEALLAGEEGFVPLVVTLRFRTRPLAGQRLVGELASLSPLRPGAPLEVVPLERAPDIGRRHAAFYDAGYFETKKTDVALKYRRLVAGEARECPHAAAASSSKEAVPEPRSRLVTAGPAAPEVREWRRVITGASPQPLALAPDRTGVPHALYRSPIAFSILFDGLTVAIDFDRDELAAAARVIERTFDEACGEGFVAANRGALWYLTKLFTPHPPGEPHFFVKPWAFMVTPPGWSSVLDGVHASGFDVLRGVVATDVFHATPAVFKLHEVGKRIRVAAGDPLLTIIPVPRSLGDAGATEPDPIESS
ncbi:MAG: hypothetical protein ABIT01_01565 [Thermoanaerobaculia bacterium]